MKSKSTPPRMVDQYGLIEALEPRIAPAAVVVMANTDALPASPKFVTAIAGANLLVKAGEVLTTGSGGGGAYLLYVEQGQVMVHTTDLNGNHQMDFNEITGLSVGAGARIVSFVDIHGDVVTDLNPDGTLTDNGRGDVVLDANIAAIDMRSLQTTDFVGTSTQSPADLVNAHLAMSSYSIFGNIDAGGGLGLSNDPTSGLQINTAGTTLQAVKYTSFTGLEVYGATQPVIGSIYVGSSVTGELFSFGASGSSHDIHGNLLAFNPAPSEAGAGIYNISAAAPDEPFSIGTIHAGDGGFNAPGGNIVNVALQGDNAGVYQLIAGNGGTGTIGPAGGSVLNFSETGAILAKVVIQSGNGGTGLTGAGGNAGQITFNSTSPVEINAYFVLNYGSGGDGYTHGGVGGGTQTGNFLTPEGSLTTATDIVTTMHVNGSIGQNTPFDFNGDGYSDAVYATVNPNQVIVALGNGSDGFFGLDSSHYIYLNSPAQVDSITVGNFTGKTNPVTHQPEEDIAVVSNTPGFAGVEVYISEYNPKTGAFEGFSDPLFSPLPSLEGYSYVAKGATEGAPYRYTPVAITKVVAGDFTGDNVTDLAVFVTESNGDSAVFLMKPETDATHLGGTGYFYADFSQAAPVLDLAGLFPTGSSIEATAPTSFTPGVPGTPHTAAHDVIIASAFDSKSFSVIDSSSGVPFATSFGFGQVDTNQVKTPNPATYIPSYVPFIGQGLTVIQDPTNPAIADVVAYSEPINVGSLGANGTFLATFLGKGNGTFSPQALQVSTANYVTLVQGTATSSGLIMNPNPDTNTYATFGQGLVGDTVMDDLTMKTTTVTAVTAAGTQLTLASPIFGAGDPYEVDNANGVPIWQGTATNTGAIMNTGATFGKGLVGETVIDDFTMKTTTVTAVSATQLTLASNILGAGDPYEVDNANFSFAGLLLGKGAYVGIVAVPDPGSGSAVTSDVALIATALPGVAIVKLSANLTSATEDGGAGIFTTTTATADKGLLAPFDVYYPYPANVPTISGSGPGEAGFVSAVSNPISLFQGLEIAQPSGSVFAGFVNSAPLKLAGYSLTAGNGGNSLSGPGGAAGTLGETLTITTSGGVSTGTGSLNIILPVDVTYEGLVQLTGGNGGNGFTNAGNGGTINGISVTYQPAASELTGTVNLQAGNGGESITGAGGSGGSLGQMFILTGNIFAAGNGGTGVIGGSAGSIFGNTGLITAETNSLTADITLTAGNGASGINGGGNGGGIFTFATEFLPIIGGVGGFLDYTGGSGGNAVAGQAGNGGSVVSSSPSAIINNMTGSFFLNGGAGGSGYHGGNGGSVVNFVQNATISEAPANSVIVVGAGGNATVGVGGAGGSISGITLSASGANFYNRMVAGQGGDSFGGSGGAGGSVSNINVASVSPGSQYVVAAGAGGAGLTAGGAGGSVVSANVDAGSINSTGKVLIIAGDGGIANGAAPQDPTNAVDVALSLGGVSGPGGAGGSILSFTQPTNTNADVDLIAGNGGATPYHSVAAGNAAVRNGVQYDNSGAGGSIIGANIAGSIGNSDPNVAIKSYNNILEGQTMQDFVDSYILGASSITDAIGNVGLVAGAAGFVESSLGSSAVLQPSTNGVNGSVSNVHAENIMSMVAGNVDQVSLIRNLTNYGVTITGGVLGAPKDVYYDPIDGTTLTTVSDPAAGGEVPLVLGTLNYLNLEYSYSDTPLPGGGQLIDGAFLAQNIRNILSARDFNGTVTG